MTTDGKIDLLVLGGGIAGLAAAANAVQRGASVVLVEKAPAVGGSAQYAGFLWTAPTVAVMREVNPEGDPALGARVVEGYEPAMEWVGSLDVHMKEPVTVLGYGRGRETDMAGLIATCRRIVREGERSELLLGTRTERLLTEDGRVAGAEVVTAAGERRRIAAASTLLATGGFGGDPELRERLIHPLARDLPLRANPHSVGDGLRLGQAVGAAFGKPDAGFYGHLVAAYAVNAAKDPHEVLELSFFHSEHSVLLNLDGRRFVDETIGDHISTLAVLEQPEARSLMVSDQRVHDQYMMQPYVEGVEPIDRFALAYRLGGRCAVAEDLEELEYLPEEWGYPGPAARKAVEEFNRQCEAGRPDPARKLDAAPLVDPPYYVAEVIPAITMTFSGLLIDDRARVLDEQGRPIPGLLAAGGDAGGTYWRAYAGGAATALVFGLQAAATALATAGAAST
jgi:succinate dehydrogenase/fumarate reductase flavoprotein subunit